MIEDAPVAIQTQCSVEAFVTRHSSTVAAFIRMKLRSHRGAAAISILLADSVMYCSSSPWM